MIEIETAVVFTAGCYFLWLIFSMNMQGRYTRITFKSPDGTTIEIVKCRGWQHIHPATRAAIRRGERLAIEHERS